MPRFVLGDAFWEIDHEGTTLVLTSGTVGKVGTPQTRRYKTAGHAEIQYDVMIRDKVAAGYELSTEAPPPPVTEVPGEDDALEAAITSSPYDAGVYGVYGDWLQSQHDVRGELIALQLAEDARPGDPQLVGAIGRYLDKHRAALLGPLVPYAGKIREFTDGPFIWRFGFIHIVQLDRANLDEPVPELVEQVLQHPSGRFVAELSVLDDDQAEVTALLRLLANHAQPSLRALELGTQADLGDLGPLLRAHPRLRRLSLHGRVGPEQAAVSPITVRSVVAAKLPELEQLSLRLLRGDVRFTDLRPLLHRTDLPALSELRLRSAEFAPEIINELIESPLAAQLVKLDLGLSELGDRAVRQFLAHRDRFAKLRELVVTRGGFARSSLADLQATVKVTVFEHDPDDDREQDDDYFDGVAE
jgi:uncharacterized protein (TIGR02996 family)